MIQIQKYPWYKRVIYCNIYLIVLKHSSSTDGTSNCEQCFKGFVRRSEVNQVGARKGPQRRKKVQAPKNGILVNMHEIISSNISVTDTSKNQN